MAGLIGERMQWDQVILVRFKQNLERTVVGIIIRRMVHLMTKM